MKKVLTSPITILTSIVLGVLAGVFYPSESMEFEVVGTIYLSLLKVVVLPFLLATILVGIVSLLQKDGSAGMIKRIVISFVLSMVLASAVGVGTVLLTSQEMTESKKASLGSLVNDRETGVDLEVFLFKPPPPVEKHNPFEMLVKFIPENIFLSLNLGESLKVVIFCLIFGIALGSVKSNGQALILDSMKAIQEASISIFKFLNYFLPFALLAMISSQVGKVGVSIFLTMLEFIYQQAVAGAVILVIGAVVLCVRSKQSILQVLNKTKDTLIIAVSSRSSLACIPYAQDSLTNLKFNKGSAELVIPLSFTVNRIGSIAYYAVSTLFIANIYNIDLGVAGLLVVLFGSVLAGLASAGTTGVLTVATVSIVCDLIRLPHEAIIVLLIAVDPIMDMIRTASHVYGNVAVASIACEKEVS